MTRRSRPWRIAAAIFIFINVAGVVWAAAEGEGLHAVAHVAILLAGYVAWRLLPWGRGQDLPRQQPVDEGRIEYLQQSVDAIALEVERIGEKQRFSDNLRVDRGDLPEDKH